MIGHDLPVWQAESERVGLELREIILSDIRARYGGKVPLYVREQFGRNALKSILSIAETNFEREDPGGDLKTFSAEMLLRYATNRSAFRVLTARTGFRPPEPSVRAEASGFESVAIVTRSGSMVFGSTGCLTMYRAFCYLPIAGRNVKPMYGHGHIVPAWCTRSAGGDGWTQDPHEGFVPVPGQMVTIPEFETLRGRWHTSPAVEIKLKYGSPDDPDNWEQTQAAIHALTTLNLGFASAG